MGSVADEDLKKAFQDLQMKMVDAKQKISEGEVQKRNYLGMSRIAELAVEQLSAFSDSTPMYRAVGRMFVLSTKEAETSRHAEESKAHKDKVIGLDRQKDYLQKSVEESEKNLREMIEARRRD